jgi:hypothetical protein
VFRSRCEYVWLPNFESCVHPHPEQAYPAVDIARPRTFDEQLSLVDETHRRKAVPAHGAQQFAREFLEAGHIVSHHTCRSGRQADRQTLLPRSALGEAYEEALRRRAVAHPPRAECAASDSYACVECMTS